FRRHDHAIDAVAALRRLLLDEGTLQRMRFVERADAFYRRYLLFRGRADWGDGGTPPLPVDEHGAGTALCEPAAELRAIELEIVAKHIEQRRVRSRRNRTAHPIYFEADGHAWSPTRRRPGRSRPRLFSLDRFY